MIFIPRCSCVQTTIWMNHMDDIKNHSENARQELYENASCFLEQILEATVPETATVRQLIHYLTNSPSSN